MFEFRVAAFLLAGASVIGLVDPAAALISLHLPGSGFYHNGGGGVGMHTAPKPAPAPKPVHMGGGYGGGMGSGGHTGSGGHMGSGHMVYGGKPPLGMHPMGMHFYGMGGGTLDHGWAHGHHGYGMGGGSMMQHMYGGHTYGMGGGRSSGEGYGMGGSAGMHTPPGTHMMGMHYYGMGGGSLAAKYGHLEHGFSPMHMQASWGYGSGQPSSYWSGPGPVVPPTWGTPMAHGPYGGPTSPPKAWGGSHGYMAHGYMAHASYHVRYASHFSYGWKASYKRTASGTGHWGWSRVSPWTYAVD